MPLTHECVQTFDTYINNPVLARAFLMVLKQVLKKEVLVFKTANLYHY